MNDQLNRLRVLLLDFSCLISPTNFSNGTTLQFAKYAKLDIPTLSYILFVHILSNVATHEFKITCATTHC